MQAYTTGRGSIMMRARSTTETSKKGDRMSIVITEIPYQVNKAKLIERIADLVREKTIEGISDLRDESDRDGMRIVIELKRGEVPEVVLNNLYKHTPLQSSFGIIMLAIVGGRPKVLNLLELVESFVEFRREVVRRRTEFELRKAEARYHILEGLKIALDHLDAVITLIRASKTVPEARDGLMTNFGLSQIQAQAILDMQLQRLTGLERQKILDELAELLKTIERLRAILASERLLMQIIVDELREVKTKYGDDRRTEIIDGESGELSIEDLIAEEDMAITVSNTGYIKRTAISTYRNQRRGGKGRIGMRTRDEDFVSHLFVASTHAYIMIFSDRGRAYWLKVHEIPDVGPGGKGKSIANLVSMEEGERIAAMLAVKEFEDDKFIVMGIAAGVVKKTALSAFSNPRAGGIIAMGVEEGRRGDRRAGDRRHRRDLHRHPQRHGDPLRGRRRPADGPHRLRRPRHHAARRRLRGGDGGREAGRHAADGHRAGLRQAHRDRRVPRAVARRRRHHQHRDLAIATARSSASPYVQEGDELLLITQQGMILRMQTNDVRAIGRATQGVRLIDIEGDDKVVSIAKLVEKEEDAASPTPSLVEDRGASAVDDHPVAARIRHRERQSSRVSTVDSPARTGLRRRRRSPSAVTCAVVELVGQRHDSNVRELDGEAAGRRRALRDDARSAHRASRSPDRRRSTRTSGREVLPQRGEARRCDATSVVGVRAATALRPRLLRCRRIDALLARPVPIHEPGDHRRDTIDRGDRSP